MPGVGYADTLEVEVFSFAFGFDCLDAALYYGGVGDGIYLESTVVDGYCAEHIVFAGLYGLDAAEGGVEFNLVAGGCSHEGAGGAVAGGGVDGGAVKLYTLD